MTVDNFNWAKSLLASQLWNYIIEGSASNQTLPFVIPKKCQSDQIICCKNSDEELEVSSNVNLTPQALHRSSTPPLPAASTSLAHAQRKWKDKAPMVETEVRRSFRLQALNNGLRRKSCSDKNRFPCSSDPPAITTKIVKNLVVSFCKAVAKDYFEEMLHQPKKKEAKAAAKGSSKKATFKP